MTKVYYIPKTIEIERLKQILDNVANRLSDEFNIDIKATKSSISDEFLTNNIQLVSNEEKISRLNNHNLIL